MVVKLIQREIYVQRYTSLSERRRSLPHTNSSDVIRQRLWTIRDSFNEFESILASLLLDIIFRQWEKEFNAWNEWKEL